MQLSILFILVTFLAYSSAFKHSRAFLKSGIVSTTHIVSSSRLWLSTADFKNGMTMEIDNVPFKLLEFLHVKPGKGSAFVRSKIKNLMNGSVQEKTFRAGESITAAQVDKTEMQFTYEDGQNFAFMNMETFEEQLIESKKIDQPKLLVPGLSVNVLIWNEQVIDVQLPNTLDVEIAEAPPNVKGNSAQGVTKTAVLVGGAEVQVPMFIETGEMIRIDTAEMKYLSRSDKS
jgi:elongation factor P